MGHPNGYMKPAKGWRGHCRAPFRTFQKSEDEGLKNTPQTSQRMMFVGVGQSHDSGRF